MAVAHFRRDGEDGATRGFHPPKVATLTAWYRAAVGQLDSAPHWRNVSREISSATVDADTITFRGDDWTLWVARRRNLR